MNLPALLGYLESVRRTPFRIGTHDCLTLSNDSWARLYGAGWADDWLGRYCHPHTGAMLGPVALAREFGFRSIVAAVDARLCRVVGVPPRGALVLGEGVAGWVGGSFGISVGMHSAHPGLHGLEYQPISEISAAWVPR